MFMRSLAIGLLGLTLAVQAQTDGSKEAYKQLEGTWLPTEAELGGNEFPKEILKKIKLVMKGNTYIAHVGEASDEGTLKVDAAKKPAAIDMLGTKGPHKDKTLLAIYERNGDTLRVCYDLAGKKRPTAFKTEKGTQQYFVIYKRQMP